MKFECDYGNCGKCDSCQRLVYSDSQSARRMLDRIAALELAAQRQETEWRKQ